MKQTNRHLAVVTHLASILKRNFIHLLV